MRISIIIPVFNSAPLLRRTLQSIRLGEAEDVEVIIRDGGSEDGIEEVVADFPDVVTLLISERDGGQYDAIAKGFAQCSGELLCWINAGDFFFPGALQSAKRVFAQFPMVDWLTGRQCVAEEGMVTVMGRSTVLISNFEIRSGVCSGGIGGHLQQEGMFWRRSLWEKVGGLDPEYKLAGDFELWLRFSKEADLYRMQNPLAAFSYHGDNRSVRLRSDYEREVAAILSKRNSMQRRFALALTATLRLTRKIPLLRECVMFLLIPFRFLSVGVISWKRERGSGAFTLRLGRVPAWLG